MERVKEIADSVSDSLVTLRKAYAEIRRMNGEIGVFKDPSEARKIRNALETMRYFYERIERRIKNER